tara:strand:- start:3729 stop:4010 length:282 start_codon:yes stop_codon:yes gene_type:complete
MGSGLIKKQKKRWMPNYYPTPEEYEASIFCIRNNFRISPLGIHNEPDKWRIGINIGPYKKGEKPSIAPHIYDKNTIWPEYYKFCKYYYDKYRK